MPIISLASCGIKNGCAVCRVFFEELARRARYEINFGNTNPDELLEADTAAYNKDYAPLIALLGGKMIV